ncbi:putative vacuolar import/degradation protein Vid24 [Rosa chinensis]|uniref:Putative vacuolar import/degradation protein Vid24 n=1 Tax=Rosa chinensis TaxID=74649 RepID=A0A2P6P4T6_ROSCH|nr:putative vacuolar import/degradation protein Vid24 [Rosa chinensis]
MRNLVFIVCRVLAVVCVVYTILLLCPKCRRELTGHKLRVMLIKIRRVVRKYYYYYSDSKAEERWSNGLPQEILLLILQRLCISDYLGEPSMCFLASCCGDGCCYQELPSSYSICASLLKVQTPPPFTLSSVGQHCCLQKDETWRVNVRIQGCDLENGYLCGTMEALNVPMADTPKLLYLHHRKPSLRIYFLFIVW